MNNTPKTPTPALVNVQVHNSTKEALASVRADIRRREGKPVTFDQALRELIKLHEDNKHRSNP